MRFVRDRSFRVVPAGRLDPSQRRAVSARGPLVRVLGAPGTGKTTVAVHAVLDRVRRGEISPRQTLVLAPTRVAAARMRHALTAELAATTASPLVSSVQAFAFGVLRRDAAEHGAPPPRLLSGPEQDVVLRELLAGHESGYGRRPDWPEGLAEATRARGFRAELRDLLMRAVEYGLDADGLAALAAREGNPVWAAAAQVLAEYDEVTALSSPGGYDPAWILTAAADLLEDEPEVLARVHDEVRVVVVDDAQELTAPAARLVRLLRGPASEVVLVGDPDAATQTFRGADPRLMMEEPAEVTCVLTRSWRLPIRVREVVARIAERIGSVGAVAHRLGRVQEEDAPPRGAGASGDAGETALPARRAATAAVAPVRPAAAPPRAKGRAAEQPTLFDWVQDDLFSLLPEEPDPVAESSGEPLGRQAAAESGLDVVASTGDVVDTRDAGERTPALDDRAGGQGPLGGRGGEVGTSGGESSALMGDAAEPHENGAGAADSRVAGGQTTPVADPADTAPSGTGDDGVDGVDVEGEVQVAVLATAAAEARYVSSRLRQAHLVDGVPYSRMAVLVRGAGRSATMRRVLAGDGVPVDVPGAHVPLREEPAVRPFLRLFEAALAHAESTGGHPLTDGTTGVSVGAHDGGHEAGAPEGRGDPPPPTTVGAPGLGEGHLDAEAVLDLLASPLGGTDSLALRRLLRALRQAEARRVEALDTHDGGGNGDTVGASGVIGSGDSGETGGSTGGQAAEPGASSETEHRGAWAGLARSPRVRTSDELLVAAACGDPVLDDLDPAAPAAGLRRIRRVLAAGVDAAVRDGDGWAPGVTAETVLWAMWDAAGLAEPWRRAALSGSQRADRDLDAVVALVDAAGRYVDRLPLRGPDGFLEHVRGQDVAGDTLVARAPADECVTLTTPAGAAGSEWDVVVVAGLQEGVWPDLRLRGSVLGSAALVDTLTGRGLAPQAARSAVRSDETRLLLVAASRARKRLLCTAVRNDEETPSPFLDLVDPVTDPRPFAVPPPPMTTADLVATLRRRLTSSALAALPREAAPAPDGDERPPGTGTGTDVEAAEEQRPEPRPEDEILACLLDRLGRAGIAGADPEDWWSLRRTSDDRPRRADGERLTVSPSKVEAFARCELRWLLAGAGGQAGEGTVASSLGTLVHDIAATVDNGDHAALVAELDRRWGELDLPPGWISRRKREDAVAMIDRLHRQHTQVLAAGWEVVGTEIDVEVALGRAVVRGRVDRLERDAEGRLRVVDLKTGSSKPPAAELPSHPQLGAYQVAVEEGAFGAHGSESAGAALMQIGKGGGVRGSLQEQQPLSRHEDPTWARDLLSRTAEGMASSTFRANAGPWCRVCESRFSCPIQPEGEMLR